MNRYKKKIIAIALTVMMFAGCIVPFEFAAYADTDTEWVVTWMSQDGKTELEKDVIDKTVTPAPQPSFDGTAPTKAADSNWTYTFAGWATSANQETGVTEDKLPAVTQDATYFAAFSKTPIAKNPDTPTIRKKTAGFQKVNLEWAAVKNPNDSSAVYYEVQEVAKDGNGATTSRLIYNGTATKLAPEFDPYPGKSTGEAKYGNKAASATARTVTYNVRAYVKDASGTHYSNWATTGNIEVVHPMYVIVKVKGKAKILKTSKSSKSVGKTKKNGYYIAFGGSRIKGENKRVIIKVNGTARYIKAGSVSKYKYVYRSTVGKNYYKGKAGYCYTNQQIEDFINDKNPASKNNFFLYVDTYHQRLYMLTRAYKGARWHIATDYKYHDLLASTGRQLSPYGSYKVANTMARKKTTGTKWWLLFNHIGIHEKLGEKLGKPASGGCIRVPDLASKWFFDHIKKGTGVFIY